MTKSPNSDWVTRRIDQDATQQENDHERIQTLGDNKFVTIDAVRDGLRTYPQLARELAIARAQAPRSRLTQALEKDYADLHRAIHRPAKSRAATFKHVCTTEIPAIFHALRWQVFWITLGFALAVFAGYALVNTYPELASLFASNEMIDNVQQGELWTDGLLNIMPSSLLSISIFTNNIMVALTAMSLGVLFGLGTIYIVALNGLMLGGVFALTAQYDLDGRLFTFIAAHGPVELSIIFIASAIGFSLGQALARPGQQTRTQAFQAAVGRGAKLMLLCVAFLIGAGLIEGNISPNAEYSLTFRLIVGWAYWLILVFALRGWRLRPAAGASIENSVQTQGREAPAAWSQ